MNCLSDANFTPGNINLQTRKTTDQIFIQDRSGRMKGGVFSVRSGFGILCVRVAARLPREASFKLHSQSGFHAPLHRKPHHLFLLLLLWKQEANSFKPRTTTWSPAERVRLVLTACAGQTGTDPRG